MKNILHLLIVSILFSLLSGVAVQASPLKSSPLLRFEQTSGGETIIITTSYTTPFKVFTVSNPDRLVIDVPSVAGKHSVALPNNYDGKLVKSVRFGQFNKKSSRFVFDLTQPVKVLAKKQVKGKLLVDIAGSFQVSSLLPPKNLAIEETHKLQKPQKTKVELPPRVTTRSNKPPLIAIDAGHGGIDSGTVSASGTQEKDVVLEYAKALREKLLSTGKYRVILTRADDQFIMLRKRVEIARKAGASLFISIHADSADEDYARGLSVYTVSEKASDKEAEALAARENKSDVIGGMDLSNSNPDIADILISLAQRETKNNSAFFADLIVLMLGDRVKLLNNTHRFAGFAVLKAPDIPSVLVEIGFLSNSQEEKNLKSKEYREKVVSGIAAGVNDYFRKKKQ